MISKTKYKETEIGKIPEEWNIRPIDECLDAIIDYRGKTPKKSTCGIKTLSAKSIKNGKIDYNQTYCISEETFIEWERRGKPKIGDILLTTEGPLGEVAQLNREGVAIAQRLLTLRGKKEKLENNYLKYYLMSPIGQSQLLSKASGTTVQGIKQSEFRKILIVLPTLREQSSIAKILSDLDSKIELNQQMNQTLESIAQALFKHWFVDFEFPNEQGKPYKSSGGKMVWSKELGKEVPEGWIVEKLGQHISLVRGCSYNSEGLKDSETALVTLKSVDRGGGFKSEGFKPYVGEYKEKHLVKTGDIVVAHTDLTQNAEVLGRPAIVRETARFNRLIASMDLGIVKPMGNMSNSYLYYLLKSDLFQNHAYRYASGTTVLHLSSKAIPSFIFPVPHKKIISRFSEIIDHLIVKIQGNFSQSEELANVRDSLLPKLMSGKIRVVTE